MQRAGKRVEKRSYLIGLVLPALVVRAVLGLSLLEIVNDLEPCGLERRNLPNGSHERVTPLHSRNSSHLVTNGFLDHLQRHSDHDAWQARSKAFEGRGIVAQGPIRRTRVRSPMVEDSRERS